MCYKHKYVYIFVTSQHTITRIHVRGLAQMTPSTHCNTLYMTLQPAATHYKTMRHPATPRNTLQHDSSHAVDGCDALLQCVGCNTLQHTASATPYVCRLQHTSTRCICNTIRVTAATHCNTPHLQRPMSVGCNTLRHAASTSQYVCNSLKHAATKRVGITLCLQRTATHCDTLQQTAILNQIRGDGRPTSSAEFGWFAGFFLCTCNFWRYRLAKMHRMP